MNLPTPDGRGWIGIGIYVMSVMIFVMIAVFPELREDEFFKTLATLVVGTGFINGVVAWAYSNNKSNEEQSSRNSRLVEDRARNLEGRQP